MRAFFYDGYALMDFAFTGWHADAAGTPMMPDREFTVRRAEDAQKSTIANLIQLYLYDMTDEGPFPVGSDGRFEYDFLDRFWQHPYLIYCDDELAGFALVIEHCPVTGLDPCWFMAEFFVLRAYRRRGLGKAAASGILQRHPGRWHVAVIEHNLRAAAFWAPTLSDYEATAIQRQFDGEDWLVREFVVETMS
ncbi:GNAT family N-acetyltransferase [uncultured Devosia sp.]|uniref:GNAT family N-acetyltransferase n=1 Tax=uncultured Devosia sp. TaxID=211434 RepID=UPI0035CCA871